MTIRQLDVLYGDGHTHKDWSSLLYDAYLLAKNSLDPSTQNGAILYDRYGRLIGAGWNRFPTGALNTPDRWERPLKYKIIEHAERNAIYDAARSGATPVNGGTLVAPWAACCDCARAVIQTGVRRLVRHKQASDRSPDFWLEDIVIADQLLHEAEVEIIDVDWTYNSGLEIRHSGEVWAP